jgi:hypothetical protein
VSKAFARTRSAKLLKTLGETYHVLPSQILHVSPGELYLDLLLTFQKDEETARPPRQRSQADDPSLTALLTQLRERRPRGNSEFTQAS